MRFLKFYYALNAPKNTEMMLFNSDGDLIFPYESEYITFVYSKDIYNDFKSDRNSILDFDGDFAPFYNYSKTYVKTAKDITDTETVNAWKTVGDIAAKLNQTFSRDTKSATLTFYTLSSNKYRYYSYTATLNPQNQIKQLNSFQHG